MKNIFYIFIALALYSCQNEKKEVYVNNSISFIDNKGDSLKLLIDGPINYKSLNKILKIEMDSFVYSTNNLYSITIENYLKESIIVEHYELNQLYEDSTFVYTIIQKGETYKKWYKSWRNADISRNPQIKSDTLYTKNKGQYWFYLDHLEEGDSMIYFNTFNTIDSSDILVQFGGVIQNGYLNLLSYESDE